MLTAIVYVDLIFKGPDECCVVEGKAELLEPLGVEVNGVQPWNIKWMDWENTEAEGDEQRHYPGCIHPQRRLVHVNHIRRE